MRITLRQLEIFTIVCKHMSFVRAAEELDMSPPGISKQIRTMERQLGFTLFEHVGRRVYLTPNGKSLIPFVDRIDERVNELQEVSLGFSDKPLIRVTLGHTFEMMLFEAMASFKKEHQDVVFQINMRRADLQVQLLEQNDADFAFVGQPGEHPNLDSEIIADIDSVLAVPSSHELASKKSPISLKALEGETMIFTEKYVEEYIKSNEELKDWFEGLESPLVLGSYMAIRDAIKAGLGIGILPLNLMEDEKELVALKCAELKFSTPLGLLYRKHKNFSPTMKAFMKHLKNCLK